MSMSSLQLPPLSLYIHIPWCERKCPYCDFNSHERTGEIPEGDYVRALLDDLEQDLSAVQGRSIESLFIGGGTPSLFSVDGVRALLKGVRERVDLAQAVEITLEANPGSADADKFAGFVDAGVNRISLGVQSLQDNCLTALGRVHDRQQALAAIEQLRGCGLHSYNVDLMHGLPGQTATDAVADLEAVIKLDRGQQKGFSEHAVNTSMYARPRHPCLGRFRKALLPTLLPENLTPPHLSWYQLTIEPNTRFHSRPPTLPDEPALADIQDSGESALKESGYDCYEVSAWSQPGHRCRHNLNYWEFGDYIGIGAGAHGKLSFPADNRILRTARRRQPQEYLSPGNTGSATDRLLAPADRIGEYMMNALRLTEGFGLGDFETRTGVERNAIKDSLDLLQEKGAINLDGERVRTTNLGRRHLDSVTAEFFGTGH